MGDRIPAFVGRVSPSDQLTGRSRCQRPCEIILANRFPLLLGWGPQYTQIYNDAYAPLPGTKHLHGILGRVLPANAEAAALG